MTKPKQTAPAAPQVSVFRRTFPRISALYDVFVLFGHGVRALGKLGVAAWWRRAEIAVVVLVLVGWERLTALFGSAEVAGIVLASLVAVTAAAWLVKPLRRKAFTAMRSHRAGRMVLWVAGSVNRGRSRRQLVKGLRELRTANSSGKLPRIRWTHTTGVGERMDVDCRAGQSAEMLDIRAEELRAATGARDVRVTREPSNSRRVYVDIVRRDTLAELRQVPWVDLDADRLSMWDAVHFGTDENGREVRLSLPERGLFVGGEPGAGKSSIINAVVAHAAKSPDCHMVLIDPNDVQLGPWKDRAAAYASDDPAEAVNALDLVRDEIDRRKKLFRTMPGIVRKLTPQIAQEYGLPLWLVAVDELAYHTSVVGKPTGPFATAARDIVARGRAFGIIPVFGTQRPTSDVVPTSLRDLFSLRLAMRCTTQASSDVILGEGWSRRGYSATDIDITQRGVGLLLAEGALPRRLKAPWVSDTTIGDLSVTTIRYRPDLPILADPTVADSPAA